MRPVRFIAPLVGAFLMTFATALCAQSRGSEGNVMPMDFGHEGERHYHAFGYYGPFVPPIVSQDRPPSIHTWAASTQTTRQKLRVVATVSKHSHPSLQRFAEISNGLVAQTAVCYQICWGRVEWWSDDCERVQAHYQFCAP